MESIDFIFDYIRFSLFLVITVTISGILLVRPFTKKRFRQRLPLTLDVIRRYKWMFFLFLIIYYEKNWVDKLNHPIRYNLELNFTELIHAIEGDFVYYFQSTLENAYLTHFFAPFYIVSYIFINYFSVIYFAFQKENLLATKMAINYMVIYILSIPFYLFMPVDVTHSIIHDVKPLLYEYSPFMNEFFSKADPFDNCFPSLHIAIPFSLFLIIWHHRKRHDDRRFDRYLYLVIVINLLYAFAILYLGVHWLIDIIGGILVGWLGWIMVETLASGYLRITRKTDRDLRSQLRQIVSYKDKPAEYRARIQARSSRLKRRCLRPFCGEGITKRVYFRVFAAIIDILIILTPGLLLFRVFPLGIVRYDDFWFFTIPIFFLYFVPLEYFFGTTVGKRIFSLHIVSRADERRAHIQQKNGDTGDTEEFSSPTLKETLKRNVLKIFYPLILLDYLINYLLRVQRHFFGKRKMLKET